MLRATALGRGTLGTLRTLPSSPSRPGIASQGRHHATFSPARKAVFNPSRQHGYTVLPTGQAGLISMALEQVGAATSSGTCLRVGTSHPMSGGAVRPSRASMAAAAERLHQCCHLSFHRGANGRPHLAPPAWAGHEPRRVPAAERWTLSLLQRQRCLVSCCITQVNGASQDFLASIDLIETCA